jgi:glycosyltransferase involved in cell wall biosynthesis
LKILLVTPYFYPSQFFGGAPHGLYKIGKELAKRNHDVVVFTSDARDLASRLPIANQILDGMHVYFFKNLTMLSGKASRFFITPELSRRLELELSTFDIIHANEYTTFQNIIIHKYATKHRIPYVVQARGSLPTRGRKMRKWFFDAFFGFRILRDASAVIALTRAEANQYRSFRVPMEKIKILPNGIDLEEYASLPPRNSFKKKLGIDENTKIILYLGRIHEIKGLDILLKAYAHIKKKSKIEKVLLVISGSDDGYLHILKKLLVSLDIEREVLLTGPLFGKDKLEAYSGSDIFILPSYYEAFPNVILEAYCCSTPVIASNVQSIADIVLDRKTGLLFKAASVESLSNSILFMLSHKNDAENMARCGREIVESKFSIEKVVDSFENMYNDIIKTKSVQI